MGMHDVASSVRSVLRKEKTTYRILPTKEEAVADTILSHLRAGRLKKAVNILFASPFPFAFSLYSDLFRLCSSNLHIVEARKVESHLITYSDPPPTFLLNRAIEAFGKCGCFSDAQELFNEMPHRDGGSWNAMITACAPTGRADRALYVFKEMHGLGVSPNEVTLASVLGSCGAMLELSLSRQIHGLIVKRGFDGNVILETSLVDVYAKCGVMSGARKMFDEIESPCSVSWNVIVRRYLEAGDEKEALHMFSKNIRRGERPLDFTFSNALVACTTISALEEGRQIHCASLKFDYVENEVVSSSLVKMYAKCGDLGSASKIADQPNSKNSVSMTSLVSGYLESGRVREAREFFDRMPEHHIITWNAMLKGYKSFNHWDEALNFIYVMCQNNVTIDSVSLQLILNVCAGLSNADLGRQVHAYVFRWGFNFNIIVGNALLDMYGKCGCLRSARIWFRQLDRLRDTISWNTLLTIYARRQMSEATMLLFPEMMLETIPNEYTFATLFASCANIFALDQGKQIHGFMIRNSYVVDDVILGSMVDMYSKCGTFDYAIKVFKEATPGDVILWNSIISGCRHHGKESEALELFDMMKKRGVEPDQVTFREVLLVCICEGYTELGGEYFESMSRDYHVMARFEHYECMVKLYSRHGAMVELEELMKMLPFDPTGNMLTCVFDSCREFGHAKLGKWAAEKYNQLNPPTPFNFDITSGVSDSEVKFEPLDNNRRRKFQRFT